jgi:hypothetical protein
MASINIPASTPLGNYRMRIGGQDTGPATPCYTGSYGTFEDYTVNVTPAPLCLPPTSIVVSNILSNSADISWTAPTPAPTGYKYVVSTSNVTPTMAGTAVATTMVSLTGLTDNTTYYVFVRSMCSPDSSIWTASSEFQTPCLATNVPYMADMSSVSCLGLLNNNGGTTWGVQNTAPTTPAGFTPPLLQYSYDDALPGDDYVFTQGLNLMAGEMYKVKYRFANNSVTFDEKMDVRIGNDVTVAAQSTILKDHPLIDGGIMRLDSATFTVPTSGVYFISFRAYSDADQFNLYLDDISVTVAPAACSTIVSATNSIAAATACAVAGMGIVSFDPAVTTVTLAAPLTIPATETVTFIGGTGAPVTIELNSNSNIITTLTTSGAIFDNVILKDMAPAPITNPVIVNNGMITLKNSHVIGTSAATEVKVQNNAGATLTTDVSTTGPNSSIKNN